MIQERNVERTATQGADAPVSIHWDDSGMRSLYSNVCNVTGTREEVVLLFGVHQAWHSAVKEVKVQLMDRIILSPYAAKRLNVLLSRVLREYEARYGALPLEALAQTVPGASQPAAEAPVPSLHG